MKYHNQKFFGIIFTFLAFILILAACSNKTVSTNPDKIKIVTTTDFYADAAKTIVGNKGSVTSIINSPSVDPHDYEPTTNVAKIVTKADFVIANGLGYDAWMDKLNTNGQYIKIGEKIMHKKIGDNPHIWYDPQTMIRYTNYLTKKLSQKYPQDKTYFEKNAQKYLTTLEPVQNELTQLKKAAQKLPNKNVYVSEPVFDYSLAAIGLKVTNQKFEAAIENGTDPSPAVIKDMQKEITDKQIALFVLNTQADSNIVENMVKRVQKQQLPILKVTETLPQGKNYQSWMLSQYQALNKILKSESK